MMADIVKFIETPFIDESMEECEYHECFHVTVTNLNNGGDIGINIESQDVFTHPSESYLIFDGLITKANGTVTPMQNNAITHLFSPIDYNLSNQLIESISYPSLPTTMLGLLKYPDEFSKVQVLNQLWYKDTATTAAKHDNSGFAARHAYLIQSLLIKGTLSFRIPLSTERNISSGETKTYYNWIPNG